MVGIKVAATSNISGCAVVTAVFKVGVAVGVVVGVDDGVLVDVNVGVGVWVSVGVNVRVLETTAVSVGNIKAGVGVGFLNRQPIRVRIIKLIKKYNNDFRI